VDCVSTRPVVSNAVPTEGDVELTEADLQILEDREGYDSLCHEIEVAFQEATVNSPAWKRPQWRIKSLARGGVICCQAHHPELVSAEEEYSGSETLDGVHLE
jgi:hypothetical protein